MMIYSDAARAALTEASEGHPPTIYLDPAGVPTGGYGHTLGLTADMVGQPVSSDQADAWLQYDLHMAIADVNTHVTVALTQHQFDALVDFAFNCGVGNFNTSTLLKKVNANDFAGADAEYARWINAGGHVLPGLVKRRALEAAWFNTPDNGVV